MARVAGADLERLRRIIEPHDTPERREAYQAGLFPRAEAVRDLDKRYRWDLFYDAGILRWEWVGDMRQQGGPLTDAHIDTALRAIVPPLQ